MAIFFFRTPQNTIIATQANHTLTPEETERLCWLYGGATLIDATTLEGHFVGPRREMITPWSTNAVEMTQNMALSGIQRIEEYMALPPTGGDGEGLYGTEFLALRMAVKVVDSLDEALEHIARYGSGHSESIVTEDPAAAQRFLNEVDAACVYWNAPTSFTDGGQFGLGAEIGISTQKLHARGPMALEEITTYKWIIRGNGQTRP